MKKILIVNTYYSGGGAAIAARRLLECLTEYSDYQVTLLTLLPNGIKDSEYRVEALAKSKIDRLKAKFAFIAERAEIFIYNGFHRNNIFDVSTARFGLDISSHPLVKEADIIHLHWINQGMISLSSLRKLSKLNKKIVWTMHDMWAFSSISHYSKDPNIYISNWYNREKALSDNIWNRKKEIYKSLNPNIVACSNWIKEMADRSILLNDCYKTSLPNPINCDKFSPSKKEKKEYFDIVFGAVSSKDKRKGFAKIIEALEHLKNNNKDIKIRFSCFGKLDKDTEVLLDRYEVRKLGFISSESEIIDIYRSADAILLASLQENLPNIIMEALSTACPVIALAVGGIPEMIIDGETGFLASDKDIENQNYPNLAQCIKRLASIYHNDFDKYIQMSNNARNFAVNNYSMPIIANRFNLLYQNILNK